MADDCVARIAAAIGAAQSGSVDYELVVVDEVTEDPNRIVAAGESIPYLLPFAPAVGNNAFVLRQGGLAVALGPVSCPVFSLVGSYTTTQAIGGRGIDPSMTYLYYSTLVDYSGDWTFELRRVNLSTGTDSSFASWISPNSSPLGHTVDVDSSGNILWMTDMYDGADWYIQRINTSGTPTHTYATATYGYSPEVIADYVNGDFWLSTDGAFDAGYADDAQLFRINSGGSSISGPYATYAGDSIYPYIDVGAIDRQGGVYYAIGDYSTTFDGVTSTNGGTGPSSWWLHTNVSGDLYYRNAATAAVGQIPYGGAGADTGCVLPNPSGWFRSRAMQRPDGSSLLVIQTGSKAFDLFSVTGG